VLFSLYIAILSSNELDLVTPDRYTTADYGKDVDFNVLQEKNVFVQFGSSVT
jgi:hypothetical protein